MIESWLEAIDYDALIQQPEITEAEAVDLGLSVKWASYNIGASSPSEYGKNDFSVLIYDRTIVLTGIADNSKVDVYDIMGNLLYSGTEHQIEINGEGVYLVKVNTMTKKIRI